MLLSLFMFPTQASTFAPKVDALYFFLVALCTGTALAVVAVMGYFAFRYRRRPGNEVGADIHGSLLLEITWTLIPFLILMGVFAWGATLYFEMSIPPKNAMEVFVVGKQWMWKTQHMEGRREINSLHVPVGRPVKLTMTSEDVIHDFFIPAFRIKADVFPGHYTTLWFEATETGDFHLFCSQYCGTEHSRMIGTVTVMKPADYEAWLAGGNAALAGSGASMGAAGAGADTSTAGPTPVQLGQKLFTEKACATCHIATPGGIGPILAGIYGTQVELATGETVTVDDAYLRESVLNSQAKVVKGYPPAMPTFAGQISEEQLMSLIAYVKSLSDGAKPAAPAAAPAAPAAAPAVPVAAPPAAAAPAPAAPAN